MHWKRSGWRVALHWRLSLFATAIATLAGCTTPAENQVRTGSDPFHQDESVAFRTTYYFRVFDYCVYKQRNDRVPVLVPRIDSLYRFRMTGKGSTLLQNVKFESGTLRAHEIEPFGARVVRDPHTRQLRFQSRQETDRLTRRESAWAEFVRLLKRYQILKTESERNKHDGDTVPPSTLDLLKDAMEKALRDYAGIGTPAQADPNKSHRRPPPEPAGYIEPPKPASRGTPDDPKPKSVEPGADEPDNAKITAAEPLSFGSGVPAEIQCPQGAPTHRGFQILGPEGWRTFNQDERLVMAMTTDSQPLISTLQELSARILDVKSSPDAVLLPISEARRNLLEARLELDRLVSDEESTPESVAKGVMDAFHDK